MYYSFALDQQLFKQYFNWHTSFIVTPNNQKRHTDQFTFQVGNKKTLYSIAAYELFYFFIFFTQKITTYDLILPVYKNLILLKIIETQKSKPESLK